MMRQAGRYLPEYRATRAQAGDFLSLCYTPDLAAEVTLQPIRRFGFDAAILFADILLVPQALGADLWFETGEGPRLSTVTTPADLARLKPAEAIHDTLAPVYETVRLLAGELPRRERADRLRRRALDRRHLHDRRPRHPGPGPGACAEGRRPRRPSPALIDRIDRSDDRLSVGQVQAGAEVVKLFDSWAGIARRAPISTISALAPDRAASSPR